MSDKFVNILTTDGSVVPQRLVDNGDGTYSLKITSSSVSSTGGASSANQTTEISRLEAIRDRLPSSFPTPNLFPVDTLGTPSTPRVQATSSASASVSLTTTCRRISMYATQGTWYSISGTATASSHYIAAGERLDFDVPASTTISVLRETTDGSIRITELA